MSKTFKYLKISYYSCIVVVITFFILVFLYVEKHNPQHEYVGLERWAIIITLCGIFGALKYLHPKVLLTQAGSIDKAIKTYVRKYFLRLVSILAIFAFNLTSYIITGSKNFIYLAFIVIFVLFLCAPNQLHIEKEEDNLSDVEPEEI